LSPRPRRADHTYLPEFTVHSAFEEHPERKITLRMLLSHTAGFTYEAPVGNNNELEPGTFDAHVRSIADTRLRFPVGSGLRLLQSCIAIGPAQVQTLMATQLPSMAAMLQNLPAMQRDFSGLLGTMEQNVGIFSRVPAGLAHYKPLVRTMQGNADNYKQVNSLPDFRLFTLFFVVPGALIVLLAGYGVFGNPLARGFSFHHRARPTAA
jgi:hypothetical protein